MPLLILVLENLISPKWIYEFWCCLFVLFYFVIIVFRLYDIPNLCTQLQPQHTFESFLFNWLWSLYCMYVKSSLLVSFQLHDLTHGWFSFFYVLVSTILKSISFESFHKIDNDGSRKDDLPI